MSCFPIDMASSDADVDSLKSALCDARRLADDRLCEITNLKCAFAAIYEENRLLRERLMAAKKHSDDMNAMHLTVVASLHQQMNELKLRCSSPSSSSSPPPSLPRPSIRHHYRPSAATASPSSITAVTRLAVQE